MKNETLIKNGKFYNTETSTLIAKSSWFTHYDTKRYVIYKTEKGTFFKVKEIALVIQKVGHAGSMKLPFVQFTDGTEGGIGSVTASKYSLNPKDSGFRDDVKVEQIIILNELTQEEVMDKYEYTLKGGVYSVSNSENTSYNFIRKYSELFDIEEA